MKVNKNDNIFIAKLFSSGGFVQIRPPPPPYSPLKNLYRLVWLIVCKKYLGYPVKKKLDPMNFYIYIGWMVILGSNFVHKV